MHLPNLPEPVVTNKPRGFRRPRPIAPEEAAAVRLLATTHHDGEIAKELGCTTWRVLHVRKKEGIAPFTLWTDDVMAIIKRRYLDDGEPARAIAKDLGLLPASLTRKCRAMGWVQSDEVKRANLRAGALASSRVYSKNCAVRKKAANPAPRPAHAPRHTPPTMVFTQKFSFGANSIVFAPAPTESETLGDRILRELSAKPLSAASLATLLGEKELLVSMQLSAFAHEGRVEAGPVGDRGLRYRVWSVVDRYSSRALPAASLRCGPDSLVVAGEAA